MAETPLKREREESREHGEEESKRRKSYDYILSILDTDEYETDQDPSSLISTLQQELSPNHSSDPLPEPSSGFNLDVHAVHCAVACSVAAATTTSATTTTASFVDTLDSSSSSRIGLKDEASAKNDQLSESLDDEIGIPNTDVTRLIEDGFNSEGAGIPFMHDGFWEFEDEAANYYMLLQPEFFM